MDRDRIVATMEKYNRPTIEHRSFYAKQYAKHIKKYNNRERAELESYSAVNKRYGEAAAKHLAVFHNKNMNEEVRSNDEKTNATRKLRKLIKSHDVSHEFSDDYSAWENGKREQGEINQAAKDVPKSLYRKMWNRHAASKFADNTFRWKNHKPKDQQFKEEIEAAGPLDNLHELSQRVLGNYVKKAIVQRRAAAASTNMTADRKILTTPVKKGVSNVVLHAQRAAGIKKAEQRLDKMNPNYDTEEENKAKVQAHTHVKTDVDRSDDYDTKTFGGKWQKWRKGI